MFEKLFTSSKAVERYSNGALLEDRVRYLVHCSAQGSTRSSLRLIAQHQLVLIDYLHLQQPGSITVEQIHTAADRWVGRNLSLTLITQPIIGTDGGDSSPTPSNGSVFLDGCR